MRNLIFAISVFFLSWSFEAWAAKILSVSQVSPTAIGLLDASTGSGSVRVDASNACVLASGGVDILGSGNCQTGSFAVSACRNANGANGRRITLFLSNPSTLTSGSNNVSVDYISFNPTTASTNTTITLSNVSGTQNVTIPIYMRVGVESFQAPGTYTGNFIFYACSCNGSGCPSDIANCENPIYESDCN